MAYTVSNHQAYSRRMQKFMMNFQALREEAARLVAIYQNEALSGAAEAWDDTDIATAAEHVDGVVLCTDINKLLTNQAVDTNDRQQWITPFIQSE